jgi:hypothetical protein
MTPKDFEDLLVHTKTELVENFKHGDATELDVITKLIIDYQEKIAKLLFDRFNVLDEKLTLLRGDLITDNSTRFQKIMEEFAKLHEK